MHKLSIDEIILKIKNEEKINCVSDDDSFSLVIEEYAPFICAAIHNGENIREELESKIALTRDERWYEEDPHTGDFISSLPIKIIGNDSRYEYDLNRSPESCIYEDAWGKAVWKEKLSDNEKKQSLLKHSNFYKVIDTLVSVIEKKYTACVVYDIHSYNYKRMEGIKAPMFNVGTTNIKKKFKPAIQDWLKRLNRIESEFIEIDAKENDVFYGKGHFLAHISKKHKGTLVLATEVKKTYCDELTGDIYHDVIQDIKEGFKVSIVENARFFINKHSSLNIKKKYDLLASEVDPYVGFVDNQIYKKLRHFDVLNFVNPKNLDSEKKKFFNNKFKKNPVFQYKPLNIHSNDFKSELFRLPISNISDVSLQNLYNDVINYFCDEVEMLTLRGSDKFLYMSLKTYGRPSKEEIEKAKYFLSSPDIAEDKSPLLNESEILNNFNEFIKMYKLKGKVELGKNMPSQAVFTPSRNLLRLRKGIQITEKQMSGLGHHEIGIHMLTTANALEQPLKIFRLGLPMNVMCQEGLAIYSEYLCSSFNIKRLKELSLRVLAVDHMIKNYDFTETFLYLKDEWRVDPDAAFDLTARVYRGGGFTKDYLYFRGFYEIKEMHESGVSLDNLLIGKTSHHYFDLINELVTRGLAIKPSHTVSLFNKEKEDKDEVLDYLISFLDQGSR
jgi:uncharacterized protein (TIGR02421 family)